MKTRSRVPFSAACLLLVSGMARLAVGAPGDTELISVGADNLARGCDIDCRGTAVSPDGRYVAFVSDAGVGPTFNSQIYLRDRQTGQNERISVNSSGEAGNGPSEFPAVSADGRYVAFQSFAYNLVPGDSYAGAIDIFVRDRLTGKTELVSASPSGGFGNGNSYNPAISADGRYVAFESYASNLVPNDTNSASDVFVRDRLTGKTARVSVNSNWAQANGGSGSAAISADGRFVAFRSGASNLVPGDSNGLDDIFVRDRQTGRTERVGVDSNGMESAGGSNEPAISADGRYVAFSSEASNLVPDDTNGAADIFVRDRLMGKTERVSVSSGGVQANDYSLQPSISPDGQFVAYESRASNLVPNDMNGQPDIFVRDRVTGETGRASINSSGVQSDSLSEMPALSANGHYVAFISWATNLVTNDFNYQRDTFLHELGETGYTLRPRFMAFGEQRLFTSRTRSFDLHNTGAVALPIVGMNIVGPNRALFTFTTTCGKTVAVAAHCAINVKFRPTSTGGKSATLQVLAGNEAVRKRNLSGTGVRAP